MKTSKLAAAAVLACALLWGGLSLRAQDQSYSTDKLEQLVAPIALYPDSLCMQVLMAATYPLQIVEADRWVQANKSLQGKALDDALSQMTWDPSVISMCKFPDVLSRMSQNLDWTQDLGNAFLAQQADVLDTIQAMRKKAYDSGNLKTTKETKVVVEQQVIQVVPANPEVIYVPAYNPTVVYGAWSYPSYYYPAAMYPPPGYALARGIAWGAGFAIGNAMFGGCDWGHHDVTINNNFYNNNTYKNANVNRNTNINNKNVNKQNWQHNASNRGNVSYKNNQLNQKYGSQNRSSVNRDQARGYDRSGGQRAGTSDMGRQGGNQGNRGNMGQSGGQGASRSRENMGAKQSSYGGYGNGNFEKKASSRGAESKARAGGGGGGSRSSSASRSGGGRSGGGRSGGGRSGGGRR